MVVYMGTNHETVEEKRLKEDKARTKYWKRFGPYLSERQWATVREDYSADGNAWTDFPFDHARSRAYRWGEDGIGGISDNHQFMCTSFAFWNEEDDILKERLFGVTGPQGNHGEDVKELYYYLDSTPTHSYMKYLYKYPQRAFPYEQLIAESSKRSRLETEFELNDTNAFKDDRYWDIYIEYAKEEDNAEEVLMRVTAYNRGPEPASLHIIPQLWFRNTWSWGIEPEENKPSLQKHNDVTIKANHWNLGDRYMQCSTSPGVTAKSPDIEPELLFTENETNKKHLYKVKNDADFVKDAFHWRIINEKKDVVNPAAKGTKSGAWYNFQDCPPNDCVVVRLKLTNKFTETPIDEEYLDDVIEKRRLEADDFYWRISPMPMTDDLRNIQRQALAGMMWNKQYYQFIWEQWAKGDPTQPPPPPSRKHIRNQAWRHLHIDDVLSMPDKWEYPFFAVWDTAFHCIPLAMIDPEFAKKQLDIMTREWYMHPNGQIPAYEWNFSDVNPPVHAWAVFRVFKIERKMYGREDLDFLERVFQKLLLNFTWWVNRKDNSGRNLFEGGFLGLDNIGLFNRSEPLPTGGTLMQADGTSWMAFYCLNMLNISLELAKHRRTYEDIASKFFEHFLLISDAMAFKTGEEEISLWNEKDGFYYDAITWGGPYTQQLPIKSLVGLIPLYATMTLEPEIIKKFPSFKKRLDWFVKNRSEVVHRNIASIAKRGKGERLLLALVSKDRLVQILEKMLDEDEFLSQYGIRSLSKYHEKNPYSMVVNGEEFKVDFVPGDSNSGLFGGNSNWRGPIWLATTFLLIESLQRFYMYYGESLKVECPKGSGEYMHLGHVAEEIQHRIQHLFARDDEGRRAANGGSDLLDFDPHFRDHVLFHEFFHADSGKGLGASHQLGWTGLVAKMIHDTGITCRLPMTPRTPSTAAAHYFDDTFGKMGRHHSRRGTGRSIGNRSDIGTDVAEDNEQEDKSIRSMKTNDGLPQASREADQDLIGHIGKRLETLDTAGFAQADTTEYNVEDNNDEEDYESKLDL